MNAAIKPDGLFEVGPSRLTDKENYTSERSGSILETTDVEGDILVDDEHEDESEEEEYDEEGFVHGMDPTGFIGDKTLLKPLTPEALAAFKTAQDRAGVVYISRIPPGMQPAKVRHLMGKYGDVGRVYLQQEDPKRAYLRRKYTSTKKPHYTEGWVEFKDKRIARSVAEMMNAQPIGGKKGSRWRDDIWTMKYLPKFKWYMLTEQVAHEAAIHRAKLRVELSQSKAEQQQYLKNVELAKVLDKRVAKKREKGEEFQLKSIVPLDAKPNPRKRGREGGNDINAENVKKKNKVAMDEREANALDAVLRRIF